MQPALLPAQDLQSLTKAVDLIAGSKVHIEWHPLFGSAMLAMPSGEEGHVWAEDGMQVQLLALDSWVNYVHRSVAVFDMAWAEGDALNFLSQVLRWILQISRRLTVQDQHDFQLALLKQCPSTALRHTTHSWHEGTQPTSLCGGHTLCHCGHIPAGSLTKLVRTMEALMKKDQQAARDKKGRIVRFQRTPAYVQAVIQDAIARLCEEESGEESEEGNGLLRTQPRGGFRDVGDHTGGVPLGTAWPLVRQALQVGGSMGLGMVGQAYIYA